MEIITPHPSIKNTSEDIFRGGTGGDPMCSEEVLEMITPNPSIKIAPKDISRGSIGDDCPETKYTAVGIFPII